MYKELAELLKNARHCVVFTGAGVSTLSGIPDFRGTNGIFSTKWHGIQVEELHDIDFFSRHPEIYYEYAKNFTYSFDEYEPNIVHKVLAGLEKQGIVKALYTQNIDMLHTRAGSKNVEEVHGSPATHSCMDCGGRMSFEEVKPIVKSGKVPRCPKCGGVVKPDIIFFGESMNLPQMEKGFEEFARADVALVLGSSLTVHPACDLPAETARCGGRIILINKQPTPFDSSADLRYDDLKAVFTELERTFQTADAKTE